MMIILIQSIDELNELNGASVQIDDRRIRVHARGVELIGFFDCVLKQLLSISIYSIYIHR